MISHLSHWLHKGVPHHNRNVGTTEIKNQLCVKTSFLIPPVSIRSLAKHSDVLLGEHVGGVAKVQLEQVRPGGGVFVIRV